MKQTRREFLCSSIAAPVALAAANGVLPGADRPTKDDISLEAWSLQRSFFQAKKWKLLDLPRITREEFNLNGLEPVNQFFENPTQRYLQELKKNAAAHGIRFVLIMVDGEGDMAAKDRDERITAAICHRKWIDIGHYLGCHAIRCNLGGPRENWQQDKDLVQRGAESFSHLLEYAKQANMNVIIENHGTASNDPDIMLPLMKMVNNPDLGILHDLAHVNPGYEPADLLRRFLPYCKGISVKGQWTPDGKCALDLDMLIDEIQKFGYHGFYGIESSYGPRSGTGERSRAVEEKLSPEQIWGNDLKGVRLTKAVLERKLFSKA